MPEGTIEKILGIASICYYSQSAFIDAFTEQFRIDNNRNPDAEEISNALDQWQQKQNQELLDA